MTYSPDLVGMPRHTFMGRPAFTGQTRSKTRSDFMSCFALHVAECEQTGRDGSAANYLMAYRMLVRYMNGRKLLPEQFTAEWLERYERWLLARGLGTNTVVFHMRYLRAVYNRAADKGIFSAINGNPFFRRHIK
ncbi:MAG: phage integrase SAM-like domain-containing protein [Alistipes sp.]|uniref:phage integrase SAM-like domain-containing protein n=1 Tax=Alistipes sp. TaxID=1872444 RepID=UPI0025C4B1E3|nr:phage integrase SAM-like domain-containing protein [Alistipes sp.]MCD8273536.1 phage integrase SAM-like domain-containing protein [Alistipes sp.]